MRTFWKIIGWGALAIVLLFVLVLAIASPVARSVVNNRGEELVGRQMHADQVIINPFWGGVTVKGFECKEQNGETDFVSFDRLYVQIAYPQLLAKRVKIRAIHLNGFNGQVLKSDDRLNFSDIIDRFAKQDSIDQPEDTVPSQWTVALDDIRLNNSTVRYQDIIGNKQWSIEDVSLRIPGLYFDNTQTNAGLEFGLPTGGRVGIVAGYRMKSNNYAIRLNLYDVHTDVVLPLVRDYLNISGLGAKLNGTLHLDGSLDAITHAHLTGSLGMSGLSIRDTHDDRIAALDELRVVIEKGDLASRTFILDTLSISGITGDYEVHDTWTTLSRLMKQSDNSDSSDSSDTSDSSDPSDSSDNKAAAPLVWMAKKVQITGHDLVYHDYSMKHDWEYAVKTLQVTGNNIATNGRNSVSVDATLTGDAILKADFTGGSDLANQDTHCDLCLTGVNMTDFDALCRNYTGYPLEGGVLTMKSRMDVVSAKLDGNTRIEIDHPRVGKKERFTKAPYKNIPLRAGFKVLTSAQDMILLDIPVTGDARNPKFSFRKVVSRALLKVFFGPLMGLNDRDKSVNADELREMQNLLGEDSLLLGNDSVRQVETDVAMTAGDSVGLSEIGEQ